MVVPFRAQVKTTREGAADRENTQRGQPDGGKNNANSRPAASNGSKRRRESERTETKKKEGNTPDGVSWAMSEMSGLLGCYGEDVINSDTRSASCALQLECVPTSVLLMLAQAPPSMLSSTRS